MKRELRVRLAAAAAGCMALAVLVPADLAETQPAPPGNNGTVKVDGEDFDSHPDNQPHVGCVFQIDFYNFDGGESATVEFEAIPPTPGGPLLSDNVPLAAPDPNNSGLNAAATYDLSGPLAAVEPHPQQGHHVRLDVTTPDGPKSKVFWVEDCGGPPPTTPTTPPPTTPPPTTGPPTTMHPPTTARPSGGGVTPSGGGAPSRGAPSGGGAVGQGQAPPARAVPGQAQFTG
jgi:hypothetical protein